MEQINSNSKIYAAVISRDRDIDKATGAVRPVRAIQQIKMEWEQEGRRWEEKPGDVILNAIPIRPIEILQDPLFEQVKFRIVFEYVGVNNTIKRQVVGPYTKDELKEYLMYKTRWVYKERLLNDTLNHIIDAYERRPDMAITKTETETEGLLWDKNENKLVLSQRTNYKPTPEECRQCIKVVHDLQREFYPEHNNDNDKGIERKRFAHFVKIGIVAPVDFARRQNGAAITHGHINRQDLAGWSNSGKSYGYAALALRMYRLPLTGLKYVVPSGSMETEARFIEKTKWTTFPMIMEDADFLSEEYSHDDRQKRILPLIKNSLTSTNPRDILTSSSKIRNLPSCAYVMFTHNTGLMSEDGLDRRVDGHEFTIEDWKTKEQAEKYKEFFKRNGHTFGFLGDFAISYYLEHPDVLFNDWLTIAQTVLKAFYEYAAGFALEQQIPPEWLLNEVVESATSQTGLVETRAVNIIAAFRDIIQNQGWVKNSRNAAIWIAKYKRKKLTAGELDYFTPAAREAIDNALTTATMEEKVEALLNLEALPDFRMHPQYEVCIMHSIIDELKRRGINRVSHSQLKSYFGNDSGFEYQRVRFGGESGRKDPKQHRVLCIKLKDFADLISGIGRIEKEEEAEENLTVAAPPQN
ncbi:MAG: hypothetical protein M3247_01175 [Thermoproteota archaeon]|nr:hypothetical protein [Thermoproteota archaeon]